MPTTSGSAVSESPSIASISSSVGSSVGATTVTTESVPSFSIVKSPDTLISATEILSLMFNSLISTSIV